METKGTKNLTEEELLNLAKEELLRETKLAEIRADIYGAHRWAKPKILSPNKRFLKYMILSGKSDRTEKKRPREDDSDSKISDKVSKYSSENRSHKSDYKYRDKNRDKYYKDDKKKDQYKKHHSDSEKKSYKKSKK